MSRLTILSIKTVTAIRLAVFIFCIGYVVGAGQQTEYLDIYSKTLSMSQNTMVMEALCKRQEEEAYNALRHAIQSSCYSITNARLYKSKSMFPYLQWSGTSLIPQGEWSIDSSVVSKVRQVELAFVGTNSPCADTLRF